MSSFFIRYDVAGKITARYNTDVHGDNIPSDAIEISEIEWQETMASPDAWKVDIGTQSIVAVPPPSAAEVVALARAVKITEIDASCKAAIYAGFSSAALGAPYTYPYEGRDQQNLAAVVTASLVNASAPNWATNFWCADGTGVWARRAHTAAQIQQVGNDGLEHVQGHLEHRAQLVAQVADATTEAAVAAIVW